MFTVTMVDWSKSYRSVVIRFETFLTTNILFKKSFFCLLGITCHGNKDVIKSLITVSCIKGGLDIMW